MYVVPGDTLTFEQEIWFDGHQYENIPAGQIKIRRSSDGQFWTGSDWGSEQFVSTVVDGSGKFHYYQFTFPEEPDVYNFLMRANSDRNTEAVFSLIARG